MMEVFTVLETRDANGLYIAKGEWNSPHDAMKGPARHCFIRIGNQDAAEIDKLHGPFYAGEYDVFQEDELPVTSTALASKAFNLGR